MPKPPDRNSESQPKHRTTRNSVTHVVDAEPLNVARRGVLVVASGIGAGRVISLPPSEVVSLGRSKDCTCAFDDDSLSREHARIIRAQNEYVLKDASSRNGTFVNDVRTTGAVTLKDGDRIQLGSQTFLRFSLVGEDEEKALRGIYDAAILDGLTGVFNRKHLEDRITEELAYAERHGTALSVAIMDVDHFKRVNDTHGHLAGDAVLKAVAARLRGGIRPEDVLGRYGGEEFVIVARGIDVIGAALFADRLRVDLAKEPIVVGETAIAITISAGVASLVCCGTTPDRASLLRTADRRLYAAKEGGRNRVVGA